MPRSVFPSPYKVVIRVVLFLSLLVPALAQLNQTGIQESPTTTVIAQPGQFPEVVARVNDSEIGKRELLERVKAVKARINAPSGPTPLGVYQNVLNDLVDLELLYQESREKFLEATVEEVESEFQDLRSRFPTEEDFQRQLDAGGLTSDQLKLIFKKDLSIQKLVTTEFESRVAVTEESKKTFYEENQDQMQEPLRLRVRHILLSVESDASESDRRTRREKIADLRRQIVDGQADFAALAKEFSDDPGSKENGGEMVITKGQTVAPFEKTAFSLLTGAVSDVVETSYGYHIIELLERLPERPVPYTEAEAMIERYLKQDQLRQVIETEVQALRKEAEIQIFI